MNYSPVQRFFDIEIIHAVPFFLSRKRDATLYDLILKESLEVGDILVIACQIVNALCYCRERGIISHQIMDGFKRGGLYIEWIEAGLTIKKTLINHIVNSDMKYRDFCNINIVHINECCPSLI